MYKILECHILKTKKKHVYKRKKYYIFIKRNSIACNYVQIRFLYLIHWNLTSQYKKIFSFFNVFNIFFILVNVEFKGSVREKWKGYRLNAIKKRFWSLIILLLSVASIRRKLLKTSHTEYLSAHTNWENCNIWLRP